MPTFRFQRLCGPLLGLGVIFLLCCLVSFSSAGTSKTLNRSQNAIFSHPSNVAETRSSPNPHSRSLILKSLILLPLSLVVSILFLLILLPAPVITTGGRMSPGSPTTMIQMARNVLTAEECVERIACEVSRLSKSVDATSWFPLAAERILTRTKWSERMLRGVQGMSDHCSQFKCNPAKSIKRSFRAE